MYGGEEGLDAELVLAEYEEMLEDEEYDEACADADEYCGDVCDGNEDCYWSCMEAHGC